MSLFEHFKRRRLLGCFRRTKMVRPQETRILRLERLEERETPSAGEIVPPVLNYSYSIDGYNYLDTTVDGKTHIGEDIKAQANTPVSTIADGKVLFAGDDDDASNVTGFKGYGYVIVIEHTRVDGSKFVSIYGHLSPDLRVAAGQQVSAGALIGFVGTTAQNGGWDPHLHFRTDEGALPANLFDPPRNDTTKNIAYTYIGGHFTPGTRPEGVAILTRPADVIGHWNFRNDTPSDTLGWTIGHGLTAVSGASEYWRLNPGDGASDPYIVSDQGKSSPSTSTGYDGLRLSTAYFNAVRISLRSNIPGPSSNRELQLFYRLRYADGRIDANFSEARSVKATEEIKYNTFQMATFDLSTKNLPADAEIYQLRLDLGTRGDATSSDLVDLDWVRAFHSNNLRPSVLSAPTNLSGAGSLKLPVYNSVDNLGASAASGKEVVLLASSDPTLHAAAPEVARRPIEPLAPGQRSAALTEVSLTSLPPETVNQGSVYLAMQVVNTGATANLSSLDWLKVDVDPTGLRPDLVGAGLNVEPRPTTYGWGQTVTVDYRFKNQGAGYAAGPFTNGIYLSKNPYLDGTSVLLKRDSISGAAAGATLGKELSVSLPTAPPTGYGSGSMYIILAVDDSQAVAEGSESNNSGLGFAVDNIPVTVSGTPPTPGAPTIGTFTASPTTVNRGQYIYLTADNVTDDGVANEVIFYLDANGNGNLDNDDQYVADGSKSLTTFTSRVKTDNWPLGNVTLFARAKDNQGNLSVVKSLQATVLGNPPATDDAYEHNDTRATATYLGGAGTHQINNLSITANDEDYFTFDVVGGNANIVVRIDFFQEAPANRPVGNLDLGLFDRNGNNFAVSNFSQSGNTFEQIAVTQGSGRYAVRVYGSSVFGVGGTDTNSAYRLTVTVSNPSNYPVAGTLTVSPNPVRAGDNITLLLGGNTVAAGSSINGVDFFRDVNNDGQISFDEEYLGSDWGNPDGPNGAYMWTGSTAGWPAGTVTILAHVSDNLGRSSLATSAEAQVVSNLAPVIGSVVAPASVTRGTDFTITALDVSDDESVSSVKFFQDTNGNGVYDAADLNLGNGVQNGTSWSRTVHTDTLAPGTVRFFAKAYDNRGLESDPGVDINIVPSTNQPPIITSVMGPEAVAAGDSFTLQASGVSDPDGAVAQVVFYLDLNADGAVDGGDTLLGAGTRAGADWSKSVSTAGLLPGGYQFLAAAGDNGSPSLTTVMSFVVTVLPRPVVTGVTVNGGDPALAGAQRSMVKSIVYAFDQAVALNTGAVTISLDSAANGGVPAGTLPSLNWSSGDGGLTWVVTFSGAGVQGGSIADGVYDLTLHAAAVTAASGGQALAADRSDTFFRLYGDVDGNRTVNNADKLKFNLGFGTSVGSTNFLPALDLDGNGTINNTDKLRFNLNFGKVYTGFTPTL